MPFTMAFEMMKWSIIGLFAFTILGIFGIPLLSGMIGWILRLPTTTGKPYFRLLFRQGTCPLILRKLKRNNPPLHL
jgi:hypothetical protein